MHYPFFGLTDAGKVRSNNEDALAWDEDFGVGVLADGMGGYAAGEVASNAATRLIKSELVHWLAAAATTATASGAVAGTEALTQAMENCANKANTTILNAAQSNVRYAGMGTTVVAAVFWQSTLVLGHVGDSRCYRWRAGVLTQLTKDHSMLQEKVDAGLLTPKQAALAPGKNLLTRALGVTEPLQIEIHTHHVLLDDIYLMCSDGLTEMLSDAAIAHILAADTALARLGKTLVAQANARGGRDNIAVLLTRAAQTPERANLVDRLFGRMPMDVARDHD